MTIQSTLPKHYYYYYFLNDFVAATTASKHQRKCVALELLKKLKFLLHHTQTEVDFCQLFLNMDFLLQYLKCIIVRESCYTVLLTYSKVKSSSLGPLVVGILWCKFTRDFWMEQIATWVRPVCTRCVSFMICFSCSCWCRSNGLT